MFVSWIDDVSAFVSLKEKDWANSVMNNFKSSATPYRVRTYEDFMKTKEEAEVTEQSTGVTPTLEKTHLTLPVVKTSNGDKKRHITEERAPFKRLKSVSEENSVRMQELKPFKEPEWE